MLTYFRTGQYYLNRGGAWRDFFPEVLRLSQGRYHCDYAYHLTRRGRGLPLWFGFAVHGTDGYRDAIESGLAMARYTADLIDGSDGLTLVREPELSVVLFRRDGWGWDDYNSWAARLLAEEIAFVLPTSYDGEPVARLCFVHPETTKQMVGEVISTITP